MLAREAELRSLRTQIDPHFLFNTLHSISALTTADPPSARRMCVLLGDFLRDSLALGALDRITNDRELQLATRFLEIERVRFGDRLRIDANSSANGTWRVPPLLLQPLVENAVTHGVAHLIEGGVIESRSRTPKLADHHRGKPVRPRPAVRYGTGLECRMSVHVPCDLRRPARVTAAELTAPGG